MIKIDKDYTPYRDDNDSKYPGGKAIPAPSGKSAAGTPWRASLFNTIIGFFQALIVDAWGKFTISGKPDKVGDSDLLNALKKIIENMYKADINTILAALPTYIKEAPNDNHLWARKNIGWAEVIIPPTLEQSATESLKFFSNKSIMITNAETVDRRLKRYDIGLPYLSPASEVYHFDTDLKNQNQSSSISIGYSTAPTFVDSSISNGQIYLAPAVKDSPPYEPGAKSILGKFSISAKVPNRDSTFEFWIRIKNIKNIKNICVFRAKNISQEEIVFLFGGTDPGYGVAGTDNIGYGVPGDDGISYGVPVITKNRIEHYSPKGKETTNLDTLVLSENSWIHVALTAVEQKLSVLIGNSKYDFTKHYQNIQDMDFIINEDRKEINIDELNIDRTVSIPTTIFNQNTTFFIPYAALDYQQKWSVLAFDNPNRIVTNLFESEQFRQAVNAAINNSR